MNVLLDVPEIRSLDHPTQLVRIPDQIDVPLTKRVRRLVDSAPFRRLTDISQLGLVSLVYPGATHSRFEHSLGAYRLALLFVRRLAGDPEFSSHCDTRAVELFLVATLLHDIGHWPWCHPLEDLGLPGVPTHEQQAAWWLEQPALADALREDWNLRPAEIVRVLNGRPEGQAEQIVCSLLSGPVDVDKMDYLARDSLHCGVPYGRNLDPGRLIGSLCLDESGTRLAITPKGKTAAEMMVFARYVMFSEVYWHHAVRSATAMFQRAAAMLFEHPGIDPVRLALSSGNRPAGLLAAARNNPAAAELLDGLFGPVRQLYKRWWQSPLADDQGLQDQIAFRDPKWLMQLAARLAAVLADHLREPVPAHQVLIDAPPPQRETQFRLQVRHGAGQASPLLHEMSPVVAALAMQQFDVLVKKVRVLVHPALLRRLRERMMDQRADRLLGEAVATLDRSPSG